MRRNLVMGLGALALGLVATPVWAADHIDGPAASMDPAADITDVYSWMSADASKVYLVMNVTRAATNMSKFSNAVKYVIHTASAPAFGMPPTQRTDVICTFDAMQVASCWLEDRTGMKNVDFVMGDASNPAGIESVNKKVKLFAGLRNDPFFFNLSGFKATASTVKAAKMTLMFDMNGCPRIDMATSGALVNALKSNGMGGAGKDDFGGLNVLSIVLAVDKTALNGGGDILRVWGATHK